MMMAMLLATVTHWAVPPMSDVMRLPDVEPTDGEKGGTVRIVAAHDEYEPGSFVVKSDVDLGKVQLTLSELKGPNGKAFPKEDLDLKVVKVWYQNGNGWFSYFGDTGGFKLCPELLLNDEDLIRVDTAKKANYARLTAADGKVSERWLNPPAKMDKRPSTMSYRSFNEFLPMRADFADAKTLQPVRLGAGEAKQFFLTAHVRNGTPAGVYKGEIRLTCESRSSESKSKNGDESSALRLRLQTSTIPVEIKVLDFALPQPKAYFDPEMDFWTCFYNYITIGYCQMNNGGDRELAKRQFAAIMRNKAEHGQNMHWIRYGVGPGSASIFDTTPGGGQEDFLFQVESMRKAGMITKPLVGWVCGASKADADLLDQLVGHHDVYLAYGDEPSVPNLTTRHRAAEKAGQANGFKYILACGPHAFAKNAHLLDWHNSSEAPEADVLPREWNALHSGKRIAWYAAQHVGAEDPAFARRQNGLCAWLSGYNALCNYAHHLGPYNDDTTTYKPMCFFYGCHDGVLDTLQWEGFREGIDDIRYATLMCRLARQARESDNIETRRLGMKALAYFARFNRTDADLNEARMEMCRYILDLRAAMGN